MIDIGFHTDAFNSAYWNFDQCLHWAHQHGVRLIECGTIDGVSWIHGLGYQPHVALWEDPLALRRKMDQLDIRFSQVDAAFPLSRPEGSTLGVEYVLHTLRWAKLAGCPRVDTTDDRFKPQAMSDRECWITCAASTPKSSGPPSSTTSSSISNRTATSPPSRTSWKRC